MFLTLLLRDTLALKARRALPDFSARCMIAVAVRGWLSHHAASSASVWNLGIAICFLGVLIGGVPFELLLYMVGTLQTSVKVASAAVS